MSYHRFPMASRGPYATASTGLYPQAGGYPALAPGLFPSPGMPEPFPFYSLPPMPPMPFGGYPGSEMGPCPPSQMGLSPQVSSHHYLGAGRTSRTQSALSGVGSTQGLAGPHRETGFVEKLMHTYGFVECADREGRLFFHYSQVRGSIDELLIGDGIEFDVSTDRRTGKLVAVNVDKLAQGSVTFELVSNERVEGNVATLPHPPYMGQAEMAGRICYVHSGECFYLPYSMEDVVGGVETINPRDTVAFYIATDKRNGNCRALQIEFVDSAKPDTVQGVVCSLKETYGFIERADVVKEIFFHFSEYCGSINELSVGDDVQFEVHERNQREVACRIVRLPEGSVVFEDIKEGKIKGMVKRVLPTRVSRRDRVEAAFGKICYEDELHMPRDIRFGDKDIKGSYTMYLGDMVEFQIAVDRRDGLKRATNITVLDESFTKSGEVREQGQIAVMKEGYGFIRSKERTQRLFFNYSELLSPVYMVQTGDGVEFTVAEQRFRDSHFGDRYSGIRIKLLGPNAVKFDTISEEKYNGRIVKEAVHQALPFGFEKNKEESLDKLGEIEYEVKGEKLKLKYSSMDIDMRAPPRLNDVIQFQVNAEQSQQCSMAVNMTVVERLSSSYTNLTTGDSDTDQWAHLRYSAATVLAVKQQGFITALKDTYGFIETAGHEREVFFHYSAYEGDVGQDLMQGDEVEYTLCQKNGKTSAERIFKLEPGTITAEVVSSEEEYDGVVVRPLRSMNPDQEEYCGLIQMKTDNEACHQNAECYPFGIMHLVEMKDMLQVGDKVKFCLGMNPQSEKKFAVNIRACRKIIRGVVAAIKGQYGFLTYDDEGPESGEDFDMKDKSAGDEASNGDIGKESDGEGGREGSRTIFFHMSEVMEPSELKLGDKVEFKCIRNQRTGKMSASSVLRLPTLATSGPNLVEMLRRPMSDPGLMSLKPCGGAPTQHEAGGVGPGPRRSMQLEVITEEEDSHAPREVAEEPGKDEEENDDGDDDGDEKMVEISQQLTVEAGDLTKQKGAAGNGITDHNQRKKTNTINEIQTAVGMK